MQPDGTHTIHNEKHTIQNGNTTIQHGNNTIKHENNTINNVNNTIQHGTSSVNNANKTGNNTINIGTNTTNNGNRSIYDENETIHNLNNTIHNGNRLTYNENETIHDGNRSTCNENETIRNGNRSTYNLDDSFHYENYQNQDQIHEPSENMSEEYKLDNQPKWEGPQKQSANVSTSKLRLDAAATLLRVGLIKIRKRFSGNESWRAIFEMFVWSAKNKDKGFFKRLFDYTGWKIFDINKQRMYTTYETSIVTSVVLPKFVYAMNLLLETSEYTRLSAESIKKIEKMKASLSTLGSQHRSILGFVIGH